MCFYVCASVCVCVLCVCVIPKDHDGEHASVVADLKKQRPRDLISPNLIVLSIQP